MKQRTKTILKTLLCVFLGLNFCGCSKEEPSLKKEFAITNFRNKLFQLSFVDDRNGWVSGDHGLILHTEDGGKTWKKEESGTNKSLRAVSFCDPNTGWIAGGGGTIIHTENGGKSWIVQRTGVTEDLLTIKFIDCKRGFAAGVFATLLLTDDGGRTWKKSSAFLGKEETIIPENLNLDEKMRLLKEEFCGTEDEESLVPLNPLINDIFFVDSKNGWAVGETGFIWRTEDGGRNWAKQESGQTEDLFSCYFKDNQEGWATGLNGILLHTEDGGLTWKPQESHTKESIFGIAVYGSYGYGVGNAATMIKSTDGGKTWKKFMPERIEIYSWFRDIVSIKGKFIAIGGMGTILVSEDNGQSWRKIS